jgi:GT2 family glycosyltransferase
MVNIVMIAKNRPRLTQQALGSLLSQTPVESYNLTLVDDNSDVFPLGLSDYDNCVKVTLSRSKGIVGLVRNIGADVAERYWGRGDWLLFLDNDTYLHPGWLERMTHAATHPEFKILGGCRHPFHQPRPAEQGYVHQAPVRFTIDSTDAVAGYSMLMSWDTWDKYGPFDQHAVGLGQSEDFAICRKVVDAGYKVGYVSPPVLTVCGLTNTLGEKVPGYEELKAMVPGGVVAE